MERFRCLLLEELKVQFNTVPLNSKFVNNMLPEWSRFITEVKLNRGLKESNCDQLTSPHSQYPTQSSKSPQPTKEPAPADNFQLDSGSSSTENLIESLSNTLALLTQSYRSHLPQTNNQLRASSNARNKAMVQDGKVVVQDVRGRYNATNQGRPFSRTIQEEECDSDYFKDKLLLMQAQENGAVLDEEKSLFLAGEQVTKFDDDVDNSPENDLALNVDHVFEADEYPIYDEAGPSYDSNTTFEVHDHDTFVDHLDEYHEVHEMQSDVQHNYVVDYDADYTSDSNIIPYDQYVEDNKEHVV
ncbi:hypothetical protein Tco_0955844 [Tanacetum coccineum]|uniref:Integrase, catalytic region, zinc finger, CCHC-type, peptidase aspartic, catalytic n=1 Tax=Tanacetum coccineum TaxID=301880 RepID=A0ABQ5E8B3_9ASTR